jgi:hypothetical protein
VNFFGLHDRTPCGTRHSYADGAAEVRTMTKGTAWPWQWKQQESVPGLGLEDFSLSLEEDCLIVRSTGQIRNVALRAFQFLSRFAGCWNAIKDQNEDSL